MVPNKFSMVDLDGIDIVESQGIEIPGLYQKLIDAIAQCRYQVIYNWKFDGIVIPPAYVEMEIEGSEVKINENISVSNVDVVHIHSLEIHIPPVINELSVTENGEYRVPEGVDGYSPILVEVPPPELSDIVITENGIYEPVVGVNGYKKITVNVEGGAMDLLFTSSDDVGVDYSDVVLTKPCTDYDEIIILVNLILSGANHYMSCTGISTINASNQYSFNTSGNYFNIYFISATTLGRFNISGNWKIVRVLGIKNNT